MVLSRLSKACGALTVALALAVGCGDSGDDTGSTAANDASTPAANDAGGVVGDASTAGGDKAIGQTKSAQCMACHGTDLAGNAAIGASNITPDTATGIGSWSTQQIVDALLKNVDNQGAALCGQMASTKSLTETDALNIAAYLKSVPAVSKTIADTCN